MARCVAVALVAATFAVPGYAQQAVPNLAGRWSWPEVQAVRGVDSVKAAWLATSLSAAESDEVMRLVSSLTKPAVVQLLPSLMYLDGHHLSTSMRKAADSLLVRPADDLPGVVRTAYFVAAERQRRARALANTTYRADFGPITFPSTFSVPETWRPQSRGVSLSFDFAPIETQLAIVQTPDIAYTEVVRRITSHPFDMLIRHHSQSFYLEPLSRERLALNLTHAASTQPLDALYAWMMPDGFFHYADLRRNAIGYRALLDTLKQHEPELTRFIHKEIDRLIPPEIQLTRRVSYFVADQSDGWGAGDVTAVDLEYYKDDIARLVNTLVHETYHAAQGAARSLGANKPRVPKTAADSAFQQALGSVLIEGTANFVAPTAPRSASVADSMAREGIRALDRLASMSVGRIAFDADSAQALLNHGVSGGGPFYWTGAAMAKVIQGASGDAAIAEALKSDGVDYLRLYQRAARLSGGSSLLTPAITEALARQ